MLNFAYLVDTFSNKNLLHSYREKVTVESISTVIRSDCSPEL